MELQEIIANLPKKGVKKIADKAGVSHSLVSLVLSGQRENELVLEKAIEVIEDEKARKQNLADRFKKAISCD